MSASVSVSRVCVLTFTWMVGRRQDTHIIPPNARVFCSSNVRLGGRLIPVSRRTLAQRHTLAFSVLQNGHSVRLLECAVLSSAPVFRVLSYTRLLLRR